MKRVLIVTRGFFPNISPRSFRATELAKEFSRRGFRVTVLMEQNEDDITVFIKKYGITVKYFSKSVSAVPKMDNSILNFGVRIINRVLEQFADYPDILVRTRLLKFLNTNNISTDFIISSAAPHAIHWAIASSIQKGYLRYKKWIADCGDPYMRAGNMQYKRPFYFWYFENQFCTIADNISIPFEGAIQGYHSKFESKIKVIPQGFDFDEVKKLPYKKNDKFVRIGYAGTLVRGRRDPSELINYLLQKNVNFKFYVFTNKTGFLKELESMHPDKIFTCSYIDRLELLKKFSEFEFVVNFENAGTNQLPSKLIDYSLTERPILSLKVGEFNTKTVDEFLIGNYDNAYEVKDLNQYRIQNIVDKFIKLF